MHKSLLLGAISFLFLSMVSCTQQGKIADKEKKVFKLSTPNEEVFKVIRHPIKDEQGKTFEIIAYNNWGLLFTKIYLLEDVHCIDSFLLHDDSPALFDFELLPSKKRIHAIYDIRSSGCTRLSEQVIIEVKNRQIFIPLLSMHESAEHCLLGDVPQNQVDSSVTTCLLDKNLLDAKDSCVFKILDYEKKYSKTGKPTITQKQRFFSIHYDPQTGVYCDSLRYFDLPYKDCEKKTRILKGRFPVQEYGDDGDGGKYFEVFIGREWYVFLNGILSPASNRCYR